VKAPLPTKNDGESPPTKGKAKGKGKGKGKAKQKATNP
jgi:hypothetical protein